MSAIKYEQGGERTNSVSRRDILHLFAVTGVLTGSGCVDVVTSMIDAGAATSVDDARTAVIRITTERAYAEYSDEVMMSAGSGFLVDPTGIAVTNNHIVAGAGTLQVYVGSNQESYNATVLGVSECADLAVIKIDGEEFSYLSWYENDLEIGTEVWALGFPGGDPSYTTSNGSVTAFRSEPTSWAAVDTVVEHTAQLEGGNSGGPLVNSNGQVVGINYAAIDPVEQFSYTENFAIAVSVAKEIIDRLREGEDIHALGISGFAIPADGTNPTGIWVSATTSGSPASNAGIQPGDIITAIERLPMAGQGTMEEYCKVLRSWSSDGVLAIQVYRDGEILEGEINGQELQLNEDPLADPESTDTYEEYVLITDDTGLIQVAVPTEWSDIDGRPVESVPDLIAAPDVSQFSTTYGTPGVRISILDAGIDLNNLLDNLADTACTIQDPVDYTDPLYTGLAQEMSMCDNQSTIINIAARPADNSYVILVKVQLIDDRDVDALNKIIDSFQVLDESQPEANIAASN